jgi:hypothetical protein
MLAGWMGPGASVELLLSLHPCSLAGFWTRRSTRAGWQAEAGAVLVTHTRPLVAGQILALCRHLADPRRLSLQQQQRSAALQVNTGAVSSHRLWRPLVGSETCFRNSPALTGQGPLPSRQGPSLGACAGWTRTRQAAAARVPTPQLLLARAPFFLIETLPL